MSTTESVALAEIRAYWDARPCNIRHSPQPIGSREYFDEVEARKYKVEPHIPAFADFARWNGKRVLEIGCGIGTDTINFARHGAHVTAVDLSANSIEVARRRAEVFGLSENIQFVHANAEHLSDHIPAEPYDLIYSFGVIHHTPNPARVLEQIRAFLKPDSEVRIMVYHRYSWKVFWMLLRHSNGKFWRMKRLIAEHSEAQTGCPVTFAYSRKEGRDLFAHAGLDVTSIDLDHIFAYRIRDYVEYRYKKVWYLRWMPEPLFRRLEKTFGWHLCIKARKAKQAIVSSS